MWYKKMNSFAGLITLPRYVEETPLTSISANSRNTNEYESTCTSLL